MILVTGATGCLGANLTRALLTAGHRVAALRLSGDSSTALADVAGAIDWREGDLCNPASVRAALAGVTHIYHAAGLALPYEADRDRMMAVNVGGTRNLFSAALDAGVSRIVYVSSIAAVGYPDGVADETYSYNGDTIRFAYMHAKHASEAVVKEYAARGLDVVIVCPAAVIAPYCDREHGWGRVLLDIYRRQMPFSPPGGIAFLSRADLVQGLFAAMEQGRSGERYILASANVTYYKLLTAFAEAAGVPPPRYRPGRLTVQAVASILAALAPITERLWPRPRLTAGVLDLMWRQKYYDCSKAQRELNFKPQQSLQEAVAESWEWLAATLKSEKHAV